MIPMNYDPEEFGEEEAPEVRADRLERMSVIAPSPNAQYRQSEAGKGPYLPEPPKTPAPKCTCEISSQPHVATQHCLLCENLGCHTPLAKHQICLVSDEEITLLCSWACVIDWGSRAHFKTAPRTEPYPAWADRPAVAHPSEGRESAL